MQPSESSRSKVTRVASRSALSTVDGSTTASVVSTTSIVASPGASIPAPFAIPPTDQPSPCTTTVFGRVSVVMMACAAAAPPSGDSASAAAPTPASSEAIGSRTPIRPVEHTATSPAPMSSSEATFSAVAWVSWKPPVPVHAFAPPELSTTARTRPSTAPAPP